MLAEPGPTQDFSRTEHTVFARSKVQRLKVLVVGAGALGNEVVKDLGLLGVGSVTIMDGDVVETSNLTRSVLYRNPIAVGRNKAEAMARAAGMLFPQTRFFWYACEFADVGFEEIRDAELIFGCVDNDLARVEIAYTACKFDRPVCDGGLGGNAYSHGRVSWFAGRVAACYSCLLTPARRRELLTIWEATRQPCWAQDTTADEALPSTPTMSAVVGAMQVELGLRRLFGRSGASETVTIGFDPSPSLDVIHHLRGSSCPFHNESEDHVVSGTEELTFNEIMGRVGGKVIELDWPVCVRARCTSCGEEYKPLVRLGRFRKDRVCPKCGSQDVVEQEVLRRIPAGSPWADLRPMDLRLPAGHLYTVGGTFQPNL
jgi:adenylyltransferase/sulfurtransferase